MDEKYLIVNADDYGYTPSVSAGIRKTHREGIVTSTTAMMNMPSVIDDLRLAQADCPDMGIGVHLVLTAGRPLRPPQLVPSLVDSAGSFLSFAEISHSFQIDPGHLYDEWRTQIDTLLAVGLKPDHLDSHYHVSYLHEKAFEVMLLLAEEYDVPIRYPLPEFATRDYILNLLSICNVLHPDRTIVSFYDEGATFENLLNLVETLPRGVCELMCHPGFADERLYAKSSYNSRREQELDLLTHTHIRELIQANQLTTIKFSKLALLVRDQQNKS